MPNDIFQTGHRRWTKSFSKAGPRIVLFKTSVGRGTALYFIKLIGQHLDRRPALTLPEEVHLVVRTRGNKINLLQGPLGQAVELDRILEPTDKPDFQKDRASFVRIRLARFVLLAIWGAGGAQKKRRPKLASQVENPAFPTAMGIAKPFLLTTLP